MKNVVFTLVAVISFAFANAQNGIFKAGVHIGLPIGDANKTSTMNLGVDLSYLWKVSDEFSLGLTTGYTSYSSKSIKEYLPPFGYIDFKPVAAGFIPVAVTGQYSLNDNLFLGADLGYAIYNGAAEGTGGLLYQLKFGYQSKKTELFLGYKAISLDGFTLSSINLGFNYKI